MQRVGIFYNPQSQAAASVAYELHSWLEQRGLDTWCGVASDVPDAIARYDLLVLSLIHI